MGEDLRNSGRVAVALGDRFDPGMKKHWEAPRFRARSRSRSPQATRLPLSFWTLLLARRALSRVPEFLSSSPSSLLASTLRKEARNRRRPKPNRPPLLPTPAPENVGDT